MKVLACAVGFGLGPGGKLCSIVENNPYYEWYACGDELDLFIYDHNPYKDTCWSKEKTVLKRFVERYDIHYVVNVLDPELANFFTSLGLQVIYIDSLPFMWTKADLIPYDVAVYCGQKYPGYSLNPVLEPVKNFVWVDPIVQEQRERFCGRYAVINFGGLHSPFGNGEEYFEMILKSLLSVLSEEDIYISGGRNVVKLTKELFPQLSCKTYSHDDFLKLVSGSTIFITSPGLTTIYETCGMKIKTVILPPQNLSQFYNISVAEKVCREVKVLNWNWDKLSMDYLERFKNSPEEETVKYIYEQIKVLSKNGAYRKDFCEYIANMMQEDFVVNEGKIFANRGVQQVSELLYEFMEEV